jgi:diacylglycerol kinase family enzyme
MDRLTLHPVTRESARGMLAALSEFRAELLESADGYEIVVTLGGDGEIVAVLNALEKYVNERSGGPARMEIDGRNYVIHPEPD